MRHCFCTVLMICIHLFSIIPDLGGFGGVIDSQISIHITIYYLFKEVRQCLGSIIFIEYFIIYIFFKNKIK
jgi:hypothetical protein